MNLANGKIGAAAGGLALAVAFIGGWEGLRLTAYPDRLAGGLPTVCYGETRGVSLGDSHTKAECDATLEAAVVQFETGLDRCMTPPTPLPLETKVAFVSWPTTWERAQPAVPLWFAWSTVAIMPGPVTSFRAGIGLMAAWLRVSPIAGMPSAICASSDWKSSRATSAKSRNQSLLRPR